MLKWEHGRGNIQEIDSQFWQDCGRQPDKRLPGCRRPHEFQILWRKTFRLFTTLGRPE
jgi:hypothetical protein